jgi:hypothetical protein
MRNPQGHATLVGPGYLETGKPAGPAGLRDDGEADTFTCGHCQFVVHVMPMADPADMGGLCKNCMRLVCPKCHDHGGCTPWEKAIEASEARDRWRRQAGLD